VGVNGFEPNTVEEWLNALRLDEYLDLFHKRGYDTMDRIKQMWELELESVSCALLYAAICQWLYVSGLPRPQALIKKFHACHYIEGLHEVVHRDEQAQGFMGLRQRKLRSAWEWEILCRFLQNSSVSCKSWFLDSFGAFFVIFLEKITFQIVQLNM
jgi:hypothetical protein